MYIQWLQIVYLGFDYVAKRGDKRGQDHSSSFLSKQKKLSSSAKECQMIGKIFPLLLKMSMKDVLCCGRYNLSFFFVSPVALRHRNKDPTPFRHPVDVFSSFCPIVWQYFARHCRQLISVYFYAPITWVNSISLLKTGMYNVSMSASQCF
jgi:hypothetical protein